MANLLIVDDEAAIRTFLHSIADKMNHHSLEAGDGLEALEIFKTQTIDLSIVDINMPKMNGIEYLEEVKKIDPNAIVILMTGYPSAETIIQMIEDDGFTYITKPIDLNFIMDLIDRGLAFREKKVNEANK